MHGRCLTKKILTQEFHKMREALEESGTLHEAKLVVHTNGKLAEEGFCIEEMLFALLLGFEEQLHNI